MPELPEVETIRLGAKKYLVGKKIKDIEVKVPKLFLGNKKDIISSTITDVKRVAKILELVLDNGKSILIHLKMTGQLVYQPENEKISCAVGGHMQKAYGQPLPHKYTHITYTFTDGSKLYFNDLRKFGWNKVLKSDAIARLFDENYGPEPMSEKFTEKYLKTIFSKSSKNIKEFLIDQSKIGGIGNIYSNDALYWAGILPTRQAKSLSNIEIKKLKEAIERVFKLGLKYGGSSENTYVDINGKMGKYMNHSAVYRKESDPKGHVVNRIKMGTRSSFFCPICQK